MGGKNQMIRKRFGMKRVPASKYRVAMRRPWIAMLAAVSMAAIALNGCDSALTKNIRETPEAWQLLDPGQVPQQSPRIELLTPGDGPTVQLGDLVQVSVQHWVEPAGLKGEPGSWILAGDWWVWVGFRSDKESPFVSRDNRIASGLLGLRQGSSLRYLESLGGGGTVAGRLQHNPIGDVRYYSWQKHVNGFSDVFILRASGYTRVDIKRVCKARIQHRSLQLFDDGPVRVGQDYKTWISHEPRENWVQHARIDAACPDGKKATFEYGPIPLPGKPSKTVVTGYFDDWYRTAWNKIPHGVQLK